MALDYIYRNCLDLINKNELLEAETHLKKLFEDYPENCEVINTLAICFIRSGKKNDAYDLLYKSLKSNIFNENVLLTFANLLYETEEYTKSLNIFSEGNRIFPKNENFLYGMALNEEQLDNVEASLDIYNQLIENNNKDERYFINRSSLYFKLGKFNEAISDCDEAINLDVTNTKAHNNKASSLYMSGNIQSAIEVFEYLYQITPNDKELKWNLSNLYLLNGDWKKGWEYFEVRLNRIKNEGRYDLSQSYQWRGNKPLKGKTIFVQSEQGFGDTIQFCRYLRHLNDQGAKVEFSTQKQLISLLKTLDTKVNFLNHDEIPNNFDYYCPLMSLPFSLNVTLENSKPLSAYLFADEKKSEFFEEKTRTNKLKVGIVCSGNPTHNNDHNRSIPVHSLEPVFSLDCDFHMLQKDIRKRDYEFIEKIKKIKDHRSYLSDFSDTAGLISQMDLVISVDTSVAHLTGALGKPLWLLLPLVPDYRWLSQGSKSPWYESAKLYRQETTGKWDNVVHLIREELNSKIQIHKNK